MRRDRAIVYKDFYVNRFSAVKIVAVKYLEAELKDFFNTFPFDKNDVKDYDYKRMKNHIIFNLCRILGDAGFRLYEILTDYVDDLYNREELRLCAWAVFENIKFSNVN